MIDCPGRFCYPAMLVRAARIPLYSGEETRDLEARYLSPYNYPMTCFFYKRRSAATYLLNQRRRRERLSTAREVCRKDTAHPTGAVTKPPLQKRGQKMIPQITSLPPSLPPWILSLVLLIGQIQLEPEGKETR